MKLYADINQQVVVFTNDLPWVDSPMPGVQRRMLERDGEEVARATSIVRYEPGSYFAAHTHGGGEEFLVLEGVFSDEQGDYLAGTYVRNPVGSTHIPFSKDGCAILVKLWQMDPDDQQRVVIATTQATWQTGLVNGLQVLPLHTYGTERVALMQCAPGTQLQPFSHSSGEEIFVLEGTLEDEFGSYPKGTWLRSPSGSRHTPFSRPGCLLYVKTGHLNAIVSPVSSDPVVAK